MYTLRQVVQALARDQGSGVRDQGPGVRRQGSGVRGQASGRVPPSVGEATWLADVAIRQVCVDSREARPGSLFVALKGEHADGHDYVASAFGKGAVAALVERPTQGAASIIDLTGGPAGAVRELPLPRALPLALLVPDALQALQQLARARRRESPSLRVVGVTGSVGKTTAKEIIAAVLSQRQPTLKSEGNHNNEIGLPLTLMDLDAPHRYAVLEMGMYALGEIALLCEIALPQVGVVTNVGPTHLERLGSLERIAQAKAELVRALPAEGMAVLNGDDPRVWSMNSQTAARVLTFGLGEDCDVRASALVSMGLEGVRFEVQASARCGVGSRTAPALRTPMLGLPGVLSSLPAVAIGLAEGLTWDEIQAGLIAAGAGIRLVPVPGAMGMTILDDSYNASPASTLTALAVLAESPGRRVAALGDMLELGAYETEGHCQVGRAAAGALDLLIAVGPRARHMADAAHEAGLPAAQVLVVPDTESAIRVLRDVLRSGDTLLVKGSRGMAMERIVEAFRLGERDV